MLSFILHTALSVGFIAYGVTLLYRTLRTNRGRAAMRRADAFYRCLEAAPRALFGYPR